MAFSFGSAQSTPAFGASSAAPSLFGSAPAFGAASTPSLFGGGGFGAPSSAASLFGTPAPAFGASQPAQSGGGFSFGATGGGLFGAASTPAFGQSQAGFGFGQQSAPSFQLGQPQQQQAPQSAGALATVDNKPLTHYTKWEEISPQGQKQLLELEKLVSQTKEECRQLEECPRLQDAAEDEPSVSESVLEHTLRGFTSAWAADEEAVAALKERVHGLLHDTETAVRTFQRSYQWREAAKAGQGQALPPALRELLAAPVVLPSHFLRRTVAAFQDSVAEYQATVAELERLLPAAGAGARRWQAAQQGEEAALAALPAALSNIHDLLFHVAAKIDGLGERLATARAQHLQRRRQAGDYQDPFREADRRERQREQAERERVTVIPPASGQPGPAQPQPAAAPAAAPGVLALPAPGAFGASPQPAAAFGGQASQDGGRRKAKVKK